MQSDAWCSDVASFNAECGLYVYGVVLHAQLQDMFSWYIFRQSTGRFTVTQPVDIFTIFMQPGNQSKFQQRPAIAPHSNFNKDLPLHHILKHFNTVYMFTANSVRHKERDR